MSDISDMDESVIYRKEWDSMESFLSDIKTRPTLSGSGASMGGQGGKEWYGTETFDDAIKLAEQGWPKGLSRIKTLSTTLKPIEGEKADRHVMEFAECGDEVDIGRFTTNEPECMVDFKVIQVPAFGRVIKLVVVVNSSAGFSAEQLFLKGSAAVMLADLIEQSGLRSEIWAVACGKNTGDGEFRRATGASDLRVRIKAPDQPLEMDKMAFSLANAAMQRRLMFRTVEQFPLEINQKHVGSNYFYPHNPKPEPGTILVDCLQYGFGNNLTNETVPQFVDKMLASLMEPTTERLAA